MKHGRPTRWDCENDPHLDSACWRREHAARVFQAIQAVMAFAVVADVHDGYWFGEHPYRTAGWYR